MLRSSSVPVPLRVLALFIVVSALVLATLAPALADSHPAAADGQRLEDQSADVQALYRAVHGGDAEARWIAEHNAAIGASMMDDSMMMADSMDPTANMYYDRIVAVAMGRGADADLANRIAVDVIGRGAEAAFLAGTDDGVLYGIGTPEGQIGAPAPAPAATSGGGGGGTSTPAAATGSGLFVRVPAPADQTLIAGVAIGTPIELPMTSVAQPSGYGESVYSISGLPSGLSFDATNRQISGTPVYAGDYSVTYTAKQSDNVDTDDGEDGADKKPELSSSFTFTISVVTASVPAFEADDVDDVNLLAGSGEYSLTLPAATGGNGDLTYAINDLSGGDAAWLSFDADTRVLSGTIPSAAHAGVPVTYTVSDSDNVTEAADQDSIEFSVTVTADSTPALDVSGITDAAATVGVHYTLVLPAATEGNGDITYSVSGLPAGLSFDASNRTINGVPTALAEGTSTVFSVDYTAEDEDGDSTTESFDITVSS